MEGGWGERKRERVRNKKIDRHDGRKKGGEREETKAIGRISWENNRFGPLSSPIMNYLTKSFEILSLTCLTATIQGYLPLSFAEQ